MNSGAGTGVLKNVPLKTVYDPCPPGCCVPQGNAFTYFTESTVQGDFSNGYYFLTGHKTDTQYVPAAGVRSGEGGTVGGVNTKGHYWTASPQAALHGYGLYFDATSVEGNRVLPTANGIWTAGCAVLPREE